jgi:hypothetical protein
MHDTHWYGIPSTTLLYGCQIKNAVLTGISHSDELNTLNIKLFPLYPAPPSIKSWQVPLFTVRFEAFMDENWDLTMQKVR